jgi:GNAT superfamily N-acetyltransferase
MTFTIFDIKEKKYLLDKSIELFWTMWGDKNNFKFYKDTIINSCKFDNTLPRFYIALTDNKIIGTYALLMNDFTSRQDLFPWFACLYIIPEYRKNNYGLEIQRHAIQEASKYGFNDLFLCTDLEGYYERSGWTFLSNAYMISGELTKIYLIKTE